MSLVPGRRFRGQTPEERREERRERLVGAALEAFGGAGYHAVGVREICARAGLSERYFYESFPDRAALFLAVYDRCVERVRAAFEAAVAAAPPDPVAVARAGVRAFVGLLGQDPRLARVLLVDVMTIDEGVRARSLEVMSGFGARIGEIAAAFSPGLGRRGFDPRLVGDALLGATVFTAVQWVFRGRREPVDAIVDHLVLLYGSVIRDVG